jgi:hypothetical protein
MRLLYAGAGAVSSVTHPEVATANGNPVVVSPRLRAGRSCSESPDRYDGGLDGEGPP